MQRISAWIGITAGFIASASTAFAADMPTKTPITKAPVAGLGYNWTGLYFGGHLSLDWGDTQSSRFFAGAFDSFPSGSIFNDAPMRGLLGGGQIGANYQIDRWVLGIEGDLTWGKVQGIETDFSSVSAGRSHIHTYTTKNFMTVTGRIGYAWDNWLWYAKGGAAWTQFTRLAAQFNNAQLTGMAEGTQTRTGWTVGVGTELALTANWSTRFEYSYFDFARGQTVRASILTGAATGTNIDTVATQIHSIKFGVNYRLNR